MSCYQLIYTSHAVGEMTDDILLNILSVSQNKNSKLRISGLLVFDQGRFIQLLEGGKEEVETLFYSTIQHDPRHTEVQVVLETESPVRCMPTWAMGFSQTANTDSNLSRQSFFISLDETRQLCETLEGDAGRILSEFLTP